MDLTPKGKVNSWSSIFRLKDSSKDKDCCDIGNRIPGIFFRKGSTKLYICSAINGKGNVCYTSKDLPMDKTTNIVVRQVHQYDNKYRFSVLLDGKEEPGSVKVNTQALEYTDVKMFAGDEHYEPANAELDNIQFNNLGMCRHCDINPILTVSEGITGESWLT